MEMMKSKEAAAYIGVSLSTLRRYVHEEGLPVLRFPGRRKWIFRKDLIDDWVHQRSQPSIYTNGVQQQKQDKDNGYGKLRVLIP